MLTDSSSMDQFFGPRKDLKKGSENVDHDLPKLKVDAPLRVLLQSACKLMHFAQQINDAVIRCSDIFG